jgi:hypothetical protein
MRDDKKPRSPVVTALALLLFFVLIVSAIQYVYGAVVTLVLSSN